MKHVFIIGSKGIPAKYGGFETFVDKLVERRVSDEVKYHVACLSDNNNEFEYNGAHCFNVKVPNIGSAKAVYYDLAAFAYCNKYIKNNNIDDAVVYVLACRIGPFISSLKRKLNSMGGTLYVNPDGHEWKRGKWNALIKKYWKISEKFTVKNAQLLICDSKNIQKYILETYKKYNPKTIYIAYGADEKKSKLEDSDKYWTDWCSKHKVIPREYFLVVGRFVPENNYETIIREFMSSKTKKDLVIVSNNDGKKYLNVLKNNTHFYEDARIKFVGTVYEEELLKKIREQAYAYIHGHEVGGTNPSLLEALASTDLNLLFDVGFNKEVALDGAVYWNKDAGSLRCVIEESDEYSDEQMAILSNKSTQRIVNEFSWEKIVDKYERLFIEK